MEITEAQYRHIESCVPTPLGTVTLDHRQVLTASLYVAEQGCNWRGLPKRFGIWHIIYTRMTRWSQRGVVDRVCAQLQHTQILRVKIEAMALDSTIVKVPPDGTGAFKKTARTPLVSPAADGPLPIHLVAAKARTALAFPLSPGQAHDAPEGRKLLHRVGRMPRPIPLLMDRVYEGDATRQLAVE